MAVVAMLMLHIRRYEVSTSLRLSSLNRTARQNSHDQGVTAEFCEYSFYFSINEKD